MSSISFFDFLGFFGSHLFRFSGCILSILAALCFGILIRFPFIRLAPIRFCIRFGCAVCILGIRAGAFIRTIRLIAFRGRIAAITRVLFVRPGLASRRIRSILAGRIVLLGRCFSLFAIILVRTAFVVLGRLFYRNE